MAGSSIYSIFQKKLTDWQAAPEISKAPSFPAKTALCQILIRKMLIVDGRALFGATAVAFLRWALTWSILMGKSYGCFVVSRKQRNSTNYFKKSKPESVKYSACSGGADGMPKFNEAPTSPFAPDLLSNSSQRLKHFSTD